jgi:hypothetical protein
MIGPRQLKTLLVERPVVPPSQLTYVGQNLTLADVIAPDVSSWWQDEELEPCPQCGGLQLVPSSPALDAAQIRVCLTCGVVPEREVAP